MVSKIKPRVHVSHQCHGPTHTITHQLTTMESDEFLTWQQKTISSPLLGGRSRMSDGHVKLVWQGTTCYSCDCDTDLLDWQIITYASLPPSGLPHLHLQLFCRRRLQSDQPRRHTPRYRSSSYVASHLTDFIIFMIYFDIWLICVHCLVTYMRVCSTSLVSIACVFVAFLFHAV